MSEAPMARPNLPEFSVSEISGAIKRTMEEAFALVRVRGEVSGLKAAASGHVYFDLKDDKAVLNAIIWKPTARSLRVRPESGLEVVCTGRLTTYPGSSRYQLIVEQVELAGIGALMALIEQRKQQLAAEGLFEAARKKPLPFLPEVIGVITSPTGAVIRDILHRLSERFPRRVLLWPVAVQGDKAAAEVAAAIAGFNALPEGGAIPRPDVLIVARGGGSVEDLMAFNAEAVVRAAAASAIPLIAAVGHETDTTLIDYAADRRAPTPTAAAEMAVPVRADLIAALMELDQRSLRSFARAMGERRTHLNGLARALPRADELFAQPRQRFDRAGERLSDALYRNVALHQRAFVRSAALLRPASVSRVVAQGRERLAGLSDRLERAARTSLSEPARQLASLSRVLETASYKATLARGYAVVRGADGRVRRLAVEVANGEPLTLVFADGERGAIAGGEPAAPKPTTKPAAKAAAKPAAKGQGSLF